MTTRFTDAVPVIQSKIYPRGTTVLTVLGGVGAARARGFVGSVVLQLHPVVLQLLSHGVDQWELAGAALSLEVVHVDGPDHDSSEPFLLQP